MQTAQLGTTDLNLTVIGLGAWAIGGGGYVFGWGEQDDKDSISTIHAALDLGINWIDTAPVYGFGRSETVVGRALKGMSEKPVIATKCGLTWDNRRKVVPKLDAASVRSECEDSLKRLKVERIDLYQIHWPNDEPNVEAGWEEIARLKDEGKIRHAGVSNFNVEQLERCNKIMRVDSLQPHYNLLKRSIEKETLPYCAKNQMGVITYSPMQCGLLTGKWTLEYAASLKDDWRKKSPDFQPPRLNHYLAFVDGLRAIADAHNATIGQVAIQWVIQNSAVTAAIVGARRPDQIEQSVQAASLKFTEQDLSTLTDLHEKHLAQIED